MLEKSDFSGVDKYLFLGEGRRYVRTLFPWLENKTNPTEESQCLLEVWIAPLECGHFPGMGEAPKTDDNLLQILLPRFKYWRRISGIPWAWQMASAWPCWLCPPASKLSLHFQCEVPGWKDIGEITIISGLPNILGYILTKK